MKRKTIDDVCGSGAYAKYLKQKETFLKKHEEKVKSRIRARRAACQMSWAA